MLIEQIFVSPGHNYFGHHERPSGGHPPVEMKRVQCLAGRGIVGDRFLDYRENYRGQITFFSREVFNSLCEAFPGVTRSPDVFRRNVIISGIDLNTLIGQVFELQGIRFRGMCESRPCYWMNQAFCPGAEAWLKGNGGLRAQILSNGFIETGEARLVFLRDEDALAQAKA
jgi:MOSC domain-containing protein YiiM